MVKRIAQLPDKLDRVVDAATRVGPLGARALSGRVAWSGGLWLLLFFAARVVLEAQGLSDTLRVVIALAPLPAFVWFLWEFIRGIGEADELERRIQLEALAVAFPLTALLVMTLGLLQIAVPLSEEDWSYRNLWPLLYVFYIAGLAWARRRYL
jgi:hypothetical protein